MDSIEGLLIAIAETWPLQLTVQPDQGPPWAVSAGEGMRLSLRGAPMQPSALRPGQRLRASGQRHGAQALQAQTIEVL